MSLSELRSDISEKAELAASLEPSDQSRAQWQSDTDALISRFLNQIDSYATYTASDSELLTRFEEHVCGCDAPGKLLEAVQCAMIEGGILTAGPGHLGFVPGGGLYTGAVADHFAAAMNVFSADSFASPIAAHIHSEVLRWLVRMVGYGQGAWGDITSGGSLATLTAFTVARQARSLQPRAYEKCCVYLTEHTHHCSTKALDVLFAGALKLRMVPMREFAMDVEALTDLVRSDRASGLVPWMVIANAGTTNLGVVDPLAEIAAVAKNLGLWTHADAAYGGFFALCPETSERFAGLSEADSIVLDPHKGMFLPYGCGAMLIKDGMLLGRAFSHSGAYLQDRHDDSDRSKSPMDYSLELTRPFRSLRLWLALKVHGETVLRSALEEKLALARYCHACITSMSELEVLGAPSLSIFVFRVAEGTFSISANEATRLLWTRLNRHEQFFLSTTTIDGKFVIRVAILSFRTHLNTIDALVEAIRTEMAGLVDEFGRDEQELV